MVKDVNREPLANFYAALRIEEMVRDVNREPLIDLYASLRV
jgi:hypothetical protein